MWTIEPKIPLSLWWALAALAVVALGLYVARSDWNLSPFRRTVVTMLMGMGVIGPLLIALNPMWIDPVPPVPGQPALSILVDGTMSMQTPDGAPDGVTTRWQAAEKIADRVRPDPQVATRRYAFDHELHPFPAKSTDGSTKDQWPRGHRTDLAGALRESIRSGSAAGQAVLLISDGAHNVARSTDCCWPHARQNRSTSRSTR